MTKAIPAKPFAGALNAEGQEPAYVSSLKKLVAHCRAMPNTPLTAQARIHAYALLYLRYETIQLDRALTEHPFVLVERLVEQAAQHIHGWGEVLYAEAADTSFALPAKAAMEDMHQDLFQKLWTQYDLDAYKADRIARYEKRIDINAIQPLIQSAQCMDFGCGHGNFAHALLNRGATHVLGIDFGENSIRFATEMRDRLGVSPEKLAFKLASVYDSGEPDNSRDFAINNGVFHHLDDEDRAYREVTRVLKPGGWLWVYTDGEGAISHHIWDAARLSLANVPTDFVIARLEQMNLSTGKRYHLGDGFNAVYRHETWEGMTQRLSALGYGDFRRITGGFPTDFDHDAIAADPYGVEKFGSGDIRLVCRKLT